MTFSLSDDDKVTSQPLFDLGKQADPEHTDEFNQSQATKLHLALKSDSPGLDEITSSMSSGNSQIYRQMLADQDEMNLEATKNDVLSSILQSDPKEVTPEVVDVIRGLSQTEMNSPDLSDIVSRKYAELYTNIAAASMGNNVLDDAMNENPEATYDVLDRAERAAYKKNYYEQTLDEAEKAIQDQSWLSSGWNTLENMVIGSYQTYGTVGSPLGENSDFFFDVLPGGNRIEQYAYLNSISDPKEWKTVFDGAVADLKSRNPYALREWLEGYKSYGNFNSFMTTGQALVDAATAPGVGLAIKGVKVAGKAVKAASEAGKALEAGSAVKTLENAMEGAVRASSKNPQKIEEIAKSVGKYDKSSEGYFLKRLENGGIGKINKAEDVSNSTPSISDPLRMMKGYDNAPQAATDRLIEGLTLRSDIALQFLTDVNRVATMSVDELSAYADNLREAYVRANPSIEKNIIDVEVPDVMDAGGVYRANIILGMKDGTLFESAKKADNYYKRWVKGTDDYEIEQVGEGYRIIIPKNVDHTKLVKDIAVNTSQQTPSTLSDYSNWLSYLRSPTTQLSQEQNLARSVTTSSKELYDHLYSKMTEPFKKLSRKEYKNLDSFLEKNTRNQTSQENVGDFIKEYYKQFSTNPTENQIDAYLASVQIHDLDLWIRDLAVYQQKARAGVENFKVPLGDTELAFEGRVVDDLPYASKENFTVAILEDGKVKSSKNSMLIGESGRASIKQLQSEGYKIINATEADFKIGDRYYDYVITKNSSSSRIGVGNFERQLGGHKIYRDPWYIKQAMISGDDDLKFYRGDKSLFNFKTQKEADEFVPILEEARLKTLRGDPDALKYVRDNLPISTREWLAATRDGSIDLNTPFVVTRSGIRTIDTGKLSGIKNLRDSTRSEHKLQITGKFIGERSEGDISTAVAEEGTRFKSEPARLLSPTRALSSAMSDSINSRAFDNYRFLARDSFLREFGDMLEGDLSSQLASGFDVIHNPKFKSGVERIDPLRYQKAVNVSRAYRNFTTGNPGESAVLESIKEKIVSAASPALSKFGPRGQEWFEERALESITNPGAFLKSVAFKFKMGFWNPWQYFKQANSMVNIVSIAGANGMRSSVLYPFMRAALMTSRDDFILEMGRRAEKIGLQKAEDFAESMRLYKKSGFNQIGHDLSYLDDLRSPTLMRGIIPDTVSRAAGTSTKPFEEGERMTRLAAFNSAYLEKKEALKGKAITPRDEADILYRAKTLIGNMTRESNAAWQKGSLSTMTQFFSYQARIMDQFVGKQLTAAERGRLFLGYSALYGVPVAAAGVAGVIPVREWLMQKLNENGVDTNDPALTFFTDGFVTGMTNLMLDKKWNISSSYGPGGIPTFWDLLSGDKEAAELFMGAGGGIAWTTLKDSMPIFRAMASEFMDFDGGYYNLTIDDMVKPLRNISTIDSIAKVMQVYNTGIWASKNGYNLMEMDLPQAVMSVLTGLQPQEIEDSFSKYRATKASQEQFKADQKRIISEIKKLHKIEDGKTRDALAVQIKVEMQQAGFSTKEMAQTWKYAADESMLSEVFQKNFDKVIERKERARQVQGAQ